MNSIRFHLPFYKLAQRGEGNLDTKLFFLILQKYKTGIVARVRVEMPSASDPKIKILQYFKNAMVGNHETLQIALLVVK